MKNFVKRAVCMVGVVALGGLTVTACSDDGGEIEPSTTSGDASTKEPNPGPDATTNPPADGGSPADAEALEDASVTDASVADAASDASSDASVVVDASVTDAATACKRLTPGASVTSTCKALTSTWSGGTLVTKSYKLVGVVHERPTGCTVYSASTFAGALDVVAKSASAATFEWQTSVGTAIQKPVTTRYDVSVVASGAKLTYTPLACAEDPAPASVDFTVPTGIKATRIQIRVPGTIKNEAILYTFEAPAI